MDRLKDILLPKRFQEPSEVKVIKDYIRKNFKAKATITVGPKQITIGVSSAALAGALRMQLHQLQKLCETDKRLVIRIG